MTGNKFLNSIKDSLGDSTDSIIDSEKVSYNSVNGDVLKINGVPSPFEAIPKQDDDNNNYSSLKSIIDSSQLMSKTMNGVISGTRLVNFARIDSAELIKNYPYTLSIIDISKGNMVKASYRLPINPQELAIQTPFAIKTTITSGSVLEEHNGAPIKMITINGTTGGIINRGLNIRNRASGGVFAGTQNAFDQFNSSINALTEKTTDEFNIANTGYFQMNVLEMFLNTYAEYKKKSANKSWRLVLRIPKDRINYVITPQSFLKRRSVQSPLEYMYTIQALAWDTIEFKDGTDLKENERSGLKQLKKDSWSNAIGKLTDLRRTISNTKSVIGAVGLDVQTNIIGPLNTLIYAGKDILGIPKTLADTAKELKDSMIPSLIANWNELRTLTGSAGTPLDDLFKGLKNNNSDYVKNPSTPTNDKIDPSNSIKKAAITDNVDFMDKIPLSNVDLNPDQQKAIDEQGDKASKITSNDISLMISNLNSLYNSTEEFILTQDPMNAEWDLLYSIKETITTLHPLVATTSMNTSENDANLAQDPFLSKTAMQFWQGVSEQNGLIFNKPQGKFSIPFPFNSSLEQIASMYMKDPTRWTEIAALNDLQYPYVDEDGFTYSFLSNGSNNQFNVASSTNLYIGQTIYISSNIKYVSKRKISQIFQISQDNYIISIDGASDLGDYKTSDSAQMKAYLPYTVNSLGNIFIPTDEISNDVDTEESKPITYLNDTVDSIKFSKIDLLLDSNYDLAITNSGFANLAYGNANLIQAAKLKLKTPQNSLMLHPSYGAGIEIGSSNANINISNLVKKINDSFTSDPRFNSPSSVEVRVDGSAIFADIVVGINSGNGVLPITLPLSGD